MDVNHTNAAIQADHLALPKSGSPIKVLLSHDPNLILQLLLPFPIIAGGIILHIIALQWILIISVSLFYLAACVLRSASIIQLGREKRTTSFHASRILCLGNALVTMTAGISMLTYILVFAPRISALI